MLLIHNALIVPDGATAPHRGWLAAEGALITAMGQGDVPAEMLDAAGEKIDAGGRMLMPGAIDCHVHFREPGLEHKATILSESRAAVAGGVTSYIEMPNTRPATTTIAAWEDKMDRASRNSAANYAFMLGATADNLSELQRADFSLMPAVKVFMGSSTGNMLLDDDAVLRAVFADQPGRVVVHAEDQGIIDANTARFSPLPDPQNMMWHTRLRSSEACVRSTERALELASRYGTRLHVAHVTTAAETALFDPSELPDGKQFTAEVSPHHLIHTCDDYARLGSRIKMNPSVKTTADRDALRRGLAEGRLDIIATDHAPHLLAEKAGDVFHAMSGAPMVQFSLVSMLDLFGPSTVVRRMCEVPARLFGIDRRGTLAVGNFADMVLVENLPEPHVITDADVLSLCGWTPMDGTPTRHRVVRTWVNGGQGAASLKFK
ncbi:MAG: amidohydrolase family protein [Muribaculaceae bacterium]|mgnify:FL=1|nr:amidohydrolase family protein [Muribaculaceae bacterium]MCI9053926.1 amidohydrolase family protein [Muribaculaceae bacterium]